MATLLCLESIFVGTRSIKFVVWSLLRDSNLKNQGRLSTVHYVISTIQTLSVLNPAKQTDSAILNDTDLAGPLMFCLLFGVILLLVSSSQSDPEC